MLGIVKSLCGREVTDDTVRVVSYVLERYRDSGNILSSIELEAFRYFSKFDSGVYPSLDMLCEAVSNIRDMVIKAREYSGDELHSRAIDILRVRSNQLLADKLQQAALELQSGDLAEYREKELKDIFTRGVGQVGSRYEYKDIDITGIYEERLSRPDGIAFGVKELDDTTGLMRMGTLNTIAAAPGGYKSLVALNIAYRASYEEGFNVAVISLEIPKEDMIYNLLSLHSTSDKFTKYKYISHSDIREGRLDSDERDFIFNEVYPDLMGGGKGRLFLLDTSDFEVFNFANVQQVLENINKEAPLQCLMIDHINLCAYYPNSGKGGKQSEGIIINEWISFFKDQCMSFVVKGDEVQQLCTIMLMQVNRDGMRRARKGDCGRYDMMALSDAHEAERSSYRIYFSYNSPALIETKEAKVSCIKNRGGQVTSEPIIAKIDPVCYCVHKDGGASIDVLGAGGGILDEEGFFGGGLDDILGL